MYFLMVFTVIISVFPILWVIMSSFKTNAQILGNPFTLPTSISFEPYIYLFEKYDFLRYAVNSFLVCITSTLLSLLFFAMGAYVIGKYRFPGKSKAQPIFSLIMKINLYDNIWGLAVVYLSMGLAMSVFILKSTFMSIPSSLDEAARLEGAGFLRVFFQINLPLAKGGLATAGILMFLNNWNEFFYASLLTSSNKNRTLPVALQFFTESFSYDYTKLFAALTLVVLPGIILYALAQEQVQASVAASGVKG